MYLPFFSQSYKRKKTDYRKKFIEALDLNSYHGDSFNENKISCVVVFSGCENLYNEHGSSFNFIILGSLHSTGL